MENLNDYLQSLYAAGCPRDQVEAFCKYGYVATKDALSFHALARKADYEGGPVDILGEGNRGGAKSHAILAQVCLDDCQRAKNLKGLFLRKTQRAAAESFEDLVGKVCQGVPHKLTNVGLDIGKNCRFILGGYKDQKDIDNYLGQEYDIMVIEERNQIMGDKVHKLKGSSRTSKSYWRPRIYSSTNSGGVGHQATKRDFGIGKQNPTTPKTGHAFVNFSYKNNPFLNPEYKTWLEGLDGILAQMWRDDNWDIFAGQVFPELNRDLHGFTVGLPDNWPVIVAYDWGYDKPYAIIFAKMDNDGRFWVFHEIYGWGGDANVGTNETVEQVADKVKGFLAKNNQAPQIHLAGPDFFAKASGSGMMIAKAYADVFRDKGIYLTQMTTPSGSRIQGKMAIHGRLAGERPGLMIHSEACPHTWRTLPELVYDANGSGDISNDPNADEDHLCDCIRHLCRWREWGSPKVIKASDIPEEDLQSKLAEIYTRGIKKLDKPIKPKNRRVF